MRALIRISMKSLLLPDGPAGRAAKIKVKHLTRKHSSAFHNGAGVKEEAGSAMAAKADERQAAVRAARRLAALGPRELPSARPPAFPA